MTEPVSDWLVAAYRTYRKRSPHHDEFAGLYDLTAAEMAEARRRAAALEPVPERVAVFSSAPPATVLTRPDGNLAVGTVAPISRSRAKPKKQLPRLTDEAREGMLVLRTQGQTIAAIAIATGFHPNTVQQVMRDAREEGDDRAEYRPARQPKAEPVIEVEAPATVPAFPVLPANFSSVIASLRDHGLSAEEAQHQARLQLRRPKSPEPAAATAGQGVTRFPNKVPFRLSAPSLLEAAPSRDRRRVHAHNMEHETCTGPLPRGSEPAP